MSFAEPSPRSATADPRASGLSLFGFALLIAFVALFLGIGFLSANLTARPPVPLLVNGLRVCGAFAFLAAAALCYRAARIAADIGRVPGWADRHGGTRALSVFTDHLQLNGSRQ